MIAIRPVTAEAGILAPLLEDLRNAVLELQTPTQPHAVFACASADMPPAEDWLNCVLRNTTLNVLAVSDGSAWIRQDTGAAIA